MLIYLSVFIVLALILLKKTKFSFKTLLSFPFGLFVFWAFVGIFFAIDRENTIHDFYSHLLRYIILYYILINFFSSKKHLVILSWVIIISTTIFSMEALFYYYHILGYSLSTRFGVIYGAKGFIGTQNVNIGLLCSFTIILILHNFFTKINFYLKAVLAGCLFPLFSSVVLSQNRCFVAALPLSIIFLCLKKKKILVILLVSMMVMFTIIPIKYRIKHKLFADNARIGINYRSLEIIKDYPIFGIGYGLQTFGKHLDLNSYNEKIPDKYKLQDIFPDPHNMVLDVAIRMGLIGLAIFFYIIFSFSKMCWKTIKHGKDDFIQSWGYCIGATFIAFFVVGILQPILNHMPEVMLCTIFAMMTILWRINEELDVSQ